MSRHPSNFGGPRRQKPAGALPDPEKTSYRRGTEGRPRRVAGPPERAQTFPMSFAELEEEWNRRRRGRRKERLVLALFLLLVAGAGGFAYWYFKLRVQ